MFRAATFVFAVLAFSSTVRAEDSFNGQDLKGYCEDSPTFVLGYVAGWNDRRTQDVKISVTAVLKVIGANERIEAGKTARAILRRTCIPEYLRASDLSKFVCEYVDEGGSSLSLPASEVLERAFQKHLPCP